MRILVKRHITHTHDKVLVSMFYSRKTGYWKATIRAFTDVQLSKMERALQFVRSLERRASGGLTVGVFFGERCLGHRVLAVRRRSGPPRRAPVRRACQPQHTLTSTLQPLPVLLALTAPSLTALAFPRFITLVRLILKIMLNPIYF